APSTSSKHAVRSKLIRAESGTTNPIDKHFLPKQLGLPFDFLAEPFGDLDRANIIRSNTTDHMIAIHFREGVFERAPRAFSRVAFAPAFTSQRPAQFETGP